MSDTLKITKDEARHILVANSSTGLSRIQDVYECISKGVDGFIEEYGADYTLTAVTKTMIIRDKIAKQFAGLSLRNSDDYEYKDDLNSYCLAIAQKLNLRLKKMDDEGKPRPGSTDRYEQFCKQGIQLILSTGEATKINLFVGYNLDPFYTNLQRVFISCPHPDETDKILWRLSAHDLIAEENISLFPVVEEDILPINISIKEKLRGLNDNSVKSLNN